MCANVIFFVTALDSGGLENYLLRFVKKFGSRFDNIVIFCKGGKGGVLEEGFLNVPNVEIVKMNVGNFHPHHFLRVKQWLKDYKDYTICDFTGNFAGPILKIAKDVGIASRIVFYRSSSNRFKETFLKLKINNYYKNLVFQNATQILANSSFAFEFFFKGEVRDQRFKVVYNGLDIEEFLNIKDNLRLELGISNSEFVIGHTGRLNPAKNHETILQVAQNLLSKYPKLRFILCGNNVKNKLEKTIVERNLENRILLFENRDDISKFLNTCDAYFFPSITEGQPNSLIEAWAKGLPFVASNIPSIAEIVPHEFTNYLNEPFDIKGFENKLESVIMGNFSINEKDSLSKWAKNTFDADKRFSEFYHLLMR